MIIFSLVLNLFSFLNYRSYLILQIKPEGEKLLLQKKDKFYQNSKTIRQNCIRIARKLVTTKSPPKLVVMLARLMMLIV